MRKNFLAGKRPDLNWKSGWGGRRRGNLSEEEERFMGKWNAAAEKKSIKTLESVHLDYMRTIRLEETELFLRSKNKNTRIFRPFRTQSS
jgi:hypothetical protein